jgi:hypothetical protein
VKREEVEKYVRKWMDSNKTGWKSNEVTSDAFLSKHVDSMNAKFPDDQNGVRFIKHSTT